MSMSELKTSASVNVTFIVALSLRNVEDIKSVLAKQLYVPGILLDTTRAWSHTLAVVYGGRPQLLMLSSDDTAASLT